MHVEPEDDVICSNTLYLYKNATESSLIKLNTKIEYQTHKQIMTFIDGTMCTTFE